MLNIYRDDENQPYFFISWDALHSFEGDVDGLTLKVTHEFLQYLAETPVEKIWPNGYLRFSLYAQSLRCLSMGILHSLWLLSVYYYLFCNYVRLHYWEVSLWTLYICLGRWHQDDYCLDWRSLPVCNGPYPYSGYERRIWWLYLHAWICCSWR